PHHVVLWSAVELLARADWWVRGRRNREGWVRRDHLGKKVDPDARVHRVVAADRDVRRLHAHDPGVLALSPCVTRSSRPRLSVPSARELRALLVLARSQ